MLVNAGCDDPSVDPVLGLSRTKGVFFPSRGESVQISGRYTFANTQSGAAILVHGLDVCKDDPRLTAAECLYQGMDF